MSSEAARAVVRRYVEELCTQGKLEVADEIIHPHPRNPRGSQAWGAGPQGFKSAIGEYHRIFADLRRELKDIVVEGNKVVTYSTYTGTHRASGPAVPYMALGTKVELTGVATFVVEDGKMVEEPWGCNNYAGELTYPLAKAVVRYLIETVYDQGEFGRLDEVLAPDYVLHDPTMPDVPGLEAAKEMITSTRTVLPDLHDTVEDLIADGDRVVARWTARGTHRAAFMGIEPTGRQVTIAGTSVYRFDKGKIAEEWKVWDLHGALRQVQGETTDAT